MQAEPVLVHRDGPVLYLTMNRPQVLNAASRAMVTQLLDHMETAAQDPSVRLVVLRGAGDRAFCGGADTTELLSASQPEAAQFIATLEDLLWRAATLPCPVIAAINGHSLGAGAYLAAACDLRIAVNGARFHFAAARYGLVLGSWLLPRVLAPAVARDLIMTARLFDAEEAARVGLVHRVVERPAFDDAVADLVDTLVRNHPEALAAYRRVLTPGDDQARRVWEQEIEHNRRLAGTEEFRRRLRETVAARASAQRQAR